MNISGLNTPLRAISIIHQENAAPTKIPIAAIQKITFLGAAFDPIDEFKKLTASLDTPTIKSSPANTINTNTPRTHGLDTYCNNSIVYHKKR